MSTRITKQVDMAFLYVKIYEALVEINYKRNRLQRRGRYI